jgi:filamentous hemagglutinin
VACALTPGCRPLVVPQPQPEMPKPLCNEGEPEQEPAVAPELPDGIVGDQGDERAGQSGNRHNSGKLSPEHGGTGDPYKDFNKLTGGKNGPAPASDRYPPGTLKGQNGIALRPGKSGHGPRIDIPAKGRKSHETLHY